MENSSIKIEEQVVENNYEIANRFASHFFRVVFVSNNRTFDDDIESVGTTIIRGY